MPVMLLLQSRCFATVIARDIGIKIKYIYLGAHHQGLWLICSNMEDGTCFLETLNKQSVSRGYVFDPTTHS